MAGQRGEGRDGPSIRDRWSRCHECGKRGYATRKIAKRARQAMLDNGDGLRAYECPSRNGLWHLGHLRREFWTDNDEGV